MALFSRRLPRRAVAGAFVGFLYGILIMPTGYAAGSTTTMMAGAGWAILSLALLFGRAASYYTFVTWGILWIVWRAVLTFRAPSIPAVLDVIVPLLSVALLSSSAYLESLRAQDEPAE